MLLDGPPHVSTQRCAHQEKESPRPQLAEDGLALPAKEPRTFASTWALPEIDQMGLGGSRGVHHVICADLSSHVSPVVP